MTIIGASDGPSDPVGARGPCNCVTAFGVSSSAAGLSCTGLKYHPYFEFNTAKHSVIHVSLLIPFFSILVFGCLDPPGFGISRSQLPAIAVLLTCEQFY